MNTCKHCGYGFCQSRVRRVFGAGLPRGYCSAGCYTAHNFVGDTAEADAKDERIKLAEKIFDELAILNFIPDGLATDPDRAAEGIKAVAEILKGETNE